MGNIAIFCTNAINIHAGINGIEVGQSFVIDLFIMIHNIIEIFLSHNGNSDTTHQHIYSLTIIIPFLLCTLALLKSNKFPSKVFVGDTFCYFAGMTFAVVGILGHFSKTLWLFFIPQVLNFLFSIPQLFKWIPCPRHRMPGYCTKRDKLINSYTELDCNELSKLGRLSFAVAQALRLVDVQPGSKP